MLSGIDREPGRGAVAQAEEEIRVLDLGAVVLRRWRTILGTVAAVVLLVLAIVMVLPRTYTAHTVLLPPASSGGGSAQLLASQLSGLPLGGFLDGGNSNQKLVEVVLRSRALADSLVDHLRSAGELDEESEGEVRSILGRDLEVESTPNGSVVISVSAEDPERATEIANLLPELANRIIAGIGAQEAARKQEFLESQLVMARDRLVRSEQALVEFQASENAPEIQDQARRTVDAAVEVQQAIMAKEIEVARLRRTATPNNAELRAAVADLRARREQLRRLTAGTGGRDQLFVPLRESPELKLAATRLLREYTKNEQVYVALTAAVAEAQIDVNNDLPVVTVLDVALEPSAPAGPRVKLALAVAAMLGLMLGLIAAFVSEGVRIAHRNPKNEPFFAAWRQFKHDVLSLSPWKRRLRTPA